MVNSLEVLADKDIKEELLLVEIAAWLHDMVKCDDRHLETHGTDGSKITDYKQEYLQLVDLFPLITSFGSPLPFRELIEKGRPGNMKDTNLHWLIRALGFCHSAAHTEKDSVIYLLKQTVRDTRRSNPFGYESEPISGLKAQFDTIPLSQRNDRPIFKQAVEKAFNYALADTERPINDVTLWDWSNMTAALLKAILADVLLNNRITDPAFDPTQEKWRLLSVRLDNISFMTRSSRIPDLKAREKIVANGLNHVRILIEEKYSLGTEVYRDENGSVFIVPDIEILLGLKDAQGEKLSSLIIQEFSKGTIKNNPSLQLSGEVLPIIQLGKSWEWITYPNLHNKAMPIAEAIETIPSPISDVSSVKNWWQDHHEDVCTVCQQRPQGWGASDIQEHYAQQAKREPCPSTPKQCQTCKALERKMCSICERRRIDLTKEWINDKYTTTIWIDEITDTTGKIALVVGCFDLGSWLDGQMLFYPKKYSDNKSLVALKIKNLGNALEDNERVSIRNNNYRWSEPSHVLLSESEVKESQLPQRFKDPKLEVSSGVHVIVDNVEQLPNGHYRVTLTGLPPESIEDNQCRLQSQSFVVEDGLHILATNDGAKKIIERKVLYVGKLLVEQHFAVSEMIEAQAPTRLNRVWKTTNSFWQNCQNELSDEQNVGTISSRLYLQAVFEQKTDPNNELYQFHAYEFQLRDVNISVVCTEDGEFFIVDNLLRTATLLKAPIEKRKEGYTAEDYKAAAEYIKSLLSEWELVNIELPTGYGSSNKPLGKLRIKKAETRTTPYTPAIPILTEPQTFMVLVPADKALAVVDTIKDKYEREMGKVRNRLPLTVGVVFAGSRTPLPAILDAGRRMLRPSTSSEKTMPELPTGSEIWKVTDVDKSEWPLKVSLTLKKDERTIELAVPTIMGDEITEDVWYPYWCLTKDASDGMVRTRKFKGIDGKWWVHVTDLYPGDEVSFMPSRFDFELLDTAARRFEVSYKDGRRREETRSARPYCLEQLGDLQGLWDILSEGLYTSQIDTLVSLIEAKRREWRLNRGQEDSTFTQIVSDIIDNANWQEGKHPKHIGKKDILCKAAVSGQLTDVADLYMHILKEKTKVDQKGEKQ